MYPINTIEANCKDCYRCLRVCPVKAINFATGEAKIMAEKCILCSRCVNECPQQVKKIRDDSYKVKNYLRNKYKVALSISPTFVTYFKQMDCKVLFARLRAMGFQLVEESAVIAPQVVEEYKKIIDERKDFLITSHCPVIVNLVEKYYPKLIDHLAPLVSPIAIHGSSIKQRLGKDTLVIYAGPCIGKMHEQGMFGKIDVVLTFEQLKKLMDEIPVEDEEVKEIMQDIEEYDLPGRLLSLPGGINRLLEDAGYLTDPEMYQLSGIKDCQETLKELNRSSQWMENIKVLDLLACRGGCISGHKLDKQGSILSRKMALLERCEQLEGRKPFVVEPVDSKRIIRQFEDRKLEDDDIPPEAIHDVLNTVRQYSKHKGWNCGGCGYDTCYEKAKAVVKEEAHLEMCIPYMKTKAESTAHTIVKSNPNAIIVFDDDLIIQEINPKAKEFFGSYGIQEGNALFEYIDTRYHEKVVDTGKSVEDIVQYYKDLDLWTRQIIVPMCKTKHLYMTLITDITEQERKRIEMEKMKEELLNKANYVINNQMTVAQKIASLLGETTAETKITLLNLIKYFNEETGRD